MMFRTKAPLNWRKRLERTGATDGGWSIHYRDSESGEQWVEYYPYKEDRAPSYFRRADLPTSIEELFQICLNSPSEEDWQGLGAHASGAFDTEQVATVLERLVNDVSARALKEFGSFFHPYDNRNLMGMNYEEVTRSYERFREACARIACITQTRSKLA